MNAQNRQSSASNELQALRAAVGRNIKIAREQAGLNEQDLCRLTGIGHLYLNEIENGCRNILLNDIANISAVLGVAPNDLVNPQFRLPDDTGSVGSSGLPAQNPSIKKT